MNPKVRRHRWSWTGAGVLLVVLAVGPRPSFEEVWIEPVRADDWLAELDSWLAEREATVRDLRVGEAASVEWAGEPGVRTPLSLVYLPGFSADRHEMDPVVSDLGAFLGANAFFPRLEGHGRSPGALADATVEGWLENTVEALAVGSLIGERVVVIGTSTGGTLATWLASRPEAQGRIAAMVLVSPNFKPRNRLSRLPLYPWGVQIARLVAGPEYCWEPANEAQALHWDTCYPVEAIATMMALVEHVRRVDVSTIAGPVLVLYSPEDLVVDPAETLRVVEAMTGAQVELQVVENTTDRSRHVLAGDILSPETNDFVGARIVRLLERQGLTAR